MRMSGLAVLAALAAMMLTTGVASAHDTDLGNVYFGGTGEDSAYEVTHYDEDPWKGWISVSAVNQSDTAWGNFHFKIADVGEDVSNVLWVIDDPYEPTTSMTLDAGFPQVDNSAYGGELDFELYGDPVAVGNSANFQVYTDNTTDEVDFGVMFYPTPIPEPATLAMLAFGGMAVTLRRRTR
ncbi:MAG: PEP-CTERM sorting domain-containing protein [Planctomycetota bacterium]